MARNRFIAVTPRPAPEAKSIRGDDGEGHIVNVYIVRDDVTRDMFMVLEPSTGFYAHLHVTTDNQDRVVPDGAMSFNVMRKGELLASERQLVEHIARSAVRS